MRVFDNLAGQVDKVNKTIKNFTIQVQQTHDYALFEFMSENRAISRGHVNKQKRSLLKYGWLKDQPMQVVKGNNGKFLIVDGQHRFLAAQELDQLIYYMERKGTDDHFSAIQVHHTYTRAWTIKDFVHHWAARDVESYKKIALFSQQFNIPVSSALSVLSGNYSGLRSNQSLVGVRPDQKTNPQADFKEGLWKLDETRYQIALEAAQRMVDIRDAHPLVQKLAKEGRFINAVLFLVSHPDYDHDRMLTAMERQYTVFTRCLTFQHYLEMLLGIYNHKLTRNRLTINVQTRSMTSKMKEEINAAT